ncbi:hypothetical protein LTR37_004908 [Vermiconidia calcicola]|uniref:Uncharacterized protein n=1 Tax=Vermiconidia calcicola TaxID=1690605 RepID=A0ACC3NLB1_9PEZI|nr:hypothetical protein LTR37_004908 [Vermiconidia calcicola]
MATTASTTEVKNAIGQYLISKNVPPTQSWLRDFLPSIRLNTPIVALQKTALFRILCTDLRSSVSQASATVLPSDISAPEVKERRLDGAITVQVLDIEDIGHSRWSQFENLEAVERGEMTKGREIIRVADEETNTDPNHTATGETSSGPHKLLLQDAKGTKVYAFEMEAVSGVGVQQLFIGAKLVLRDALVARGVVMLQVRSVEVLGGKVEAWDKKWRGERKEMLKRKAGMQEGEGG